MQIRVGKPVVRVAKWVSNRVRIRTRPGYQRLGSSSTLSGSNSPSKLLNWGKKFKRGAGFLCPKTGSDPVLCKKAPVVPKGHLAVYVGEDDGEWRRVLVPVIYFNHPLFSDLLREAEKKFGFEHPRGAITIPCRLTEFERVRTRIESGSGMRHKTRRWGWRLHC